MKIKQDYINNPKIVYYENELEDEFSDAVIKPRIIGDKYKYKHGILWEVLCAFIQNVFSMPVKVLYKNIIFKHKYVGKEKLKQCNNRGYFIYANHTQAFADTFLTSVAVYPKRNFLIVNPENVSMKDNGKFVELLGAIPIPDTKTAMKNFLEIIEKRIKNKSSITIYPEAHIWPYYTKIRPFKDVSFKYPIQLDTPVYCMTNTYQTYGKNKDKLQIISYIDGPFYSNKELNKKEQQKDLRDRVYNQMVERSKNSNIEYIKYVKKEMEEKTNEEISKH